MKVKKQHKHSHNHCKKKSDGNRIENQKLQTQGISSKCDENRCVSKEFV